MTYEEALRIGTMAEGTIKCTYAELFSDVTGKDKLFSIQRAKPHKFYKKLYNDDGVFVGYDETTALEYINVNGSGGLDYALEDIAIVQVDGDPVNTSLVPCKLLYDTYVYIINAITASGKYSRVTWEKHETLKANAQHPNDYNVTYTKNIESFYDARTKRLLDILQDYYIHKKPIYVKRAAFDWHPIELREDATSSDTTNTETTETITEKKKKKDNALKLLLLALASNFIGE